MLFALAAALLLSNDNRHVRRETSVFGTRAVIIINGMDEDKAAAAIVEVFARFRQMHHRFHPWQSGELTNINNAVKNNALPISISAGMEAMITLSANSAERGEDLFNPALGALVSLWGFHQHKTQQPPDAEAIAGFVKDMPSLRAMTIKQGRIISAHPKTQLDFGAIAKGASLDAARDILRAHGVMDALINVGGNMMAMGDNEGKGWRAGLSGGGGKVFGAVILKDGESLAISGGGEQNFVYEGKQYHHIINPTTGYPATNAALAAVISDDATNAGALSDSCATALVIANEPQAARILQNCNIKSALRITPTATITTPPMSARLQR